MTVDEFIELKVQPEYRSVVEKVRSLIKEAVPNVSESISYGIPAYRLKRIIAVISPTKKDITLSFSRGVDFEDKYKLLSGVGKVSKHVKIKSLETINTEALKYYIKQAVEMDEE